MRKKYREFGILLLMSLYLCLTRLSLCCRPTPLLMRLNRCFLAIETGRTVRVDHSTSCYQGRRYHSGCPPQDSVDATRNASHWERHSIWKLCQSVPRGGGGVFVPSYSYEQVLLVEAWKSLEVWERLTTTKNICREPKPLSEQAHIATFLRPACFAFAAATINLNAIRPLQK